MAQVTPEDADVLRLLEKLREAGFQIDQLIRQVRVYQLRTQGVPPTLIATRLGICKVQVHRDLRKELQRRRAG